MLDRRAALAVTAAALGVDDDLHRAGLTAHACVGLLLALEEEFGVHLPAAAMGPSTFRSIAAIASALTRAAAAAPVTVGFPR